MTAASKSLTTAPCESQANSGVLEKQSSAGAMQTGRADVLSSRGPVPESQGRQVLNAMDRFELTVDDVLRSVGHPGHFQQTLAWLDARLDEGTLRQAVARLALRYPIVNARLRRKGNRACWQFSAVDEPWLEIVNLADDDDARVWQHAEELLATHLDLKLDAPITFHLLRRPTLPDVFVLQWAHSLMDGKSGEAVLCELSRLLSEDLSSITGEAPLVDDEIKANVRRHAWRRRWRAFFGLRQNRLREPVKMLVGPERNEWLVAPIRLAGRTLDTHETEKILARSRRLFGFVNPTPVLLASAYRAAERVAPAWTDQPKLYRTLVPVNLRLTRCVQPIFRNLISYITFLAETKELDDRDRLARRLHDRMRDQIRRRADVGLLMAVLMSDRFPRLVRRRLRNNPAGSVSFGFAYHGEASKQLDSLCGTGLRRLFTLTSIASPPGFAVSISLHQRRLNIGLSYVSASIPEERATEFLDAFTADLLD